MPKITDVGYGDLTSYVPTFMLIGHDPTEGGAADQTKRLELQDFVNMLYQLIPRPGMMLNGKLSVTVASNDLIVAIKTRAGTDPSPTDSVAININGTVRAVTAATSCTLADATNWMNLGASETATLENRLFVYAIWDSNSSVVAVAPSRIPYGRLVSDFSSTTTNEKYLGNYANYTSTDDVANIGAFSATLSAGAGYTWTVPTFTNANLIQEPCFETPWTTYVPTLTGFSANPTSTIYQYKLIMGEVFVRARQLTAGTSNATTFTMTAPFTAMTLTNGIWSTTAAPAVDNGVLTTTPALVRVSSASATINVYKNTDGGTTGWTNVNGKVVGYFQLQYPLV